ncbi:MAG: PKD domain-containing protein, partial [Actinomycetota bacterium]
FCYQGPAFSRHDLIAGVGDLNGDGHHDPGEPGTNQSAEKFWLEAAIDFAPAAATNLIATEHCVTATLHPFNNPAGFPDEAPVGGYDIVIQGFAADASETVVSETVVTDSDGNATVCYDGPATSRHDIIAGIGDLNGDGHLDPGEPGTFQEAHKHWVEGILNLNPGDAVNFAGTEHCVTGEFVTTPSGDPALDVGGHDTVFTVTSGGDPITSGTRITAPDGTTAFCYTGPSGSRTDDISAFVDVNGDGDRDAPTEPASRVVHKTWVATQLDLDPPTATNTVGTEHCVTGTFNASVLPLAGYDTIYAVSSGGDPVTTGTQETLSDGTTTFCYTGPSSPRTDDITAFVDLDRNGVQNSAEPGASATKAWVAPNTPPVVGPITAPIDPVTVGTEIHASADFTDPDIGDVHTATWDWGDGTQSAGTVTEPTPLTDGHVTGSHTYTTPGIYTVTVTVDDGEATGSSVFRYVVIYDPNGGFVTGGGWIDSPAGSLAADPSKTGRANFGFSSKYKKGATVPTGVTEFQFKTGNLNFHSSTYEWLVVGGARAQYKGVGTINGSGSYGFKLTAIDGQLSGGGGFDKMRMKIWELATGQLVYDDQTGADDSSDASTPLGGGSIIIHKG